MNNQNELQGNEKLLTVSPHALTAGGRAVARLESGMAVFIDGGLPGQTVEVRVTKQAKNFAEAVVVKVITPAPKQQEPLCPHFEQCGGCNWQHLEYAEQLIWKQQICVDSLQRLGKVKNFEALPIIASDKQTQFRNKMEFAFAPYPAEQAEEGKRIHLGLRASKSHDIVAVPHCVIGQPSWGAILAFIEKKAEASNFSAWDDKKRTGFWRFVVMRYSENSQKTVVECITNKVNDFQKEQVQAILLEVMHNFPEVIGVEHSTRYAATQIAYGERKIWYAGNSILAEKIGPITVEIASDAFFQTNTLATEHLYAAIIKGAALQPADIVWDVCSGIGGIALYAAKSCAEVHGFEVSNSGVWQSQQNARRNGCKNVFFHEGDASQSMGARELKKPTCIIADPPRTGLSKEMRQHILRCKPKKLVLVGCDPATQARDVAVFCEAGYTVKTLQAVDMFPHTHHVETVIELYLASN